MRDLNQTTVWIFCRVIDNFGDAGVAWRLAKNLHSEKNVQVCLLLTILPHSLVWNLR